MRKLVAEMDKVERKITMGVVIIRIHVCGAFNYGPVSRLVDITSIDTQTQ